MRTLSHLSLLQNISIRTLRVPDNGLGLRHNNEVKGIYDIESMIPLLQKTIYSTLEAMAKNVMLHQQVKL